MSPVPRAAVAGASCGSCDAPALLTPQGLCRRCQAELRFVVRPAAHREMFRRRAAAAASTRSRLEQLGVTVIDGFPADNTLWVCDWCNTPIPVAGDTTLIPLLGSYALCPTCVTTVAYWPDGWTQPVPRPCRCGACQAPVLTVLSRR